MIPPSARDGFHHPASEAELVALVKAAYREGRGLRVRGAAHSVARAIYTDAPAGDNIDVMLDRYRGWSVKDERRKLVEADAGIHLGADPNDPTGTATLENSLLSQLAAQKGWTLSNTGGVTHQTISGFVATGSAGGSLQFTSNDNLHGMRVIDGRGDVHDLSRDSDEDAVYAMAPSVGLQGVISKITLACTDIFAIEGEEAVAPARECAIDLFGDGEPGRPSLEAFLRDTEYARIEWWPQRGLERVVIWQSRRRAPDPGFEPKPYRRFAGSPEASQHLIAILFAVLGNLDDLSRAKAKLEDNFDELERVLEALAEAKDLGAVGRVLAEFLAKVIEGGVDAAITFLEPLAPVIRSALPDFFPRLAAVFVPLDADKDGAGKGEPQRFLDWGWCGLPMDNAVDDDLVPTGFTETWIPMHLTGRVMRLLDGYFGDSRDDHEAYRRTGTFVWELYAAAPTGFWLSPSYTSGDDEWRHGAFRVNPYWFADNAGEPETFFAGLWDLLREREIPFRVHWGKYQPVCAAGDRTWVELLAAQYPRWDDFLALRERRDPGNIFLTDYWRDRFGLWDAPAPRPVAG